MRRCLVLAIRLVSVPTALLVLFVGVQLLLSGCTTLPTQEQCDLKPLSDGVIVRDGWWYSSEGKLRRKYTFYDDPQGQEVPHGIVYEFAEDGSLCRAITFCHGFAEGPALAYFRSGVIEQSGFYRGDLREGEWCFYYESGKLQARGSYIQDVSNGHWVYWHESGSKAKEGQMKCGKPFGVWRFWDEASGTLTIAAFAE